MIKVLYCASEAVPFVKTGGLGDVAGSLPRFIKAQGVDPVRNKKFLNGVDIRMAIPYHKKFISKNYLTKEVSPGIYQGWEKNVPVYFIDQPQYFDRGGMYGDEKGDYTDNLERFVAFCEEILKIVNNTGFIPDIIHCNDWQTALIPVFIADRSKSDKILSSIKTILTIHNMSYQGIFPLKDADRIKVSREFFTSHALEYDGRLNLLKAGILYSDFITAVSPTYAKEIQTQELGFGLDGVLKKRSNKIFGILNGIYNIKWDPQKDKAIKQNYSSEDILLRKINKEFLQKICGLEVSDRPLAGMVARLVEQKGLDILIPAIPKLIEQGWQVVVLGTGMENYHHLLRNLTEQYCKNFFVALRFDDIFARQIYAGSDVFIVPSRYEPCGISHMIAARYGAVPVVRKTGGLADTVQDISLRDLSSTHMRGLGFVFNDYSADVFSNCMQRAKNAFQDKPAWNEIVKKNMQEDFSWEYSAKEYVGIYNRLMGK